MGFLRRISDLTLLDKVKSADIRESLLIELLLLRLERSLLRWYGHMTRMSQERTAEHCFLQHPLVEGLEAVPKLDVEITLKILLSWSRLGILPQHLPFVAEDRDAWKLQLKQLPPPPQKISGSRKVG